MCVMPADAVGGEIRGNGTVLLLSVAEASSDLNQVTPWETRKNDRNEPDLRDLNAFCEWERI